jgi:hypothetical protein
MIRSCGCRSATSSSSSSRLADIHSRWVGVFAAKHVLWMFRSSYNRKPWLQERYQQQQTGGYAQQVGGSV